MFPFEDLPVDLLLCVLDHFPTPIRGYCTLLGINHKIRATAYGSATTLSFATMEGELSENVYYCIPTASELAALVGPCHGLRVLEFPRHYSLFECGRGGPVTDAWVDQAFGGHELLRELHIPSGSGLSEYALMRILAHLGGLEVFTLGTAGDRPGLADFQATSTAGRTERLTRLPFGTGLLAALGSHCPRLTRLELWFAPLASSALDFGLLGGCPGLRELSLATSNQTLGVLLQARRLLPHLETLDVPALMAAPPPSLRRLTVRDPASWQDLDPALSGLSALEHLWLPLGAAPMWAGPSARWLESILHKNRGTLTTLHLAHPLTLRPEALCDLPALRELTVHLGPKPTLTQLVPALSRVVYATVFLGPYSERILGPLVLTSRRLQSLAIIADRSHASVEELTLHCPNLRRLDVTGLYSSPQSKCVTTLDCPLLETLLGLPACTLAVPCGPLVRLRTLSGGAIFAITGHPWFDQIPVLFPALRAVRALSAPGHGSVEALCRGALLPDLQALTGLALSGDINRLPPVLTLQLGATLRDLELTPTWSSSRLSQLTVDGPGLTRLAILDTTASRVTLRTPALRVLRAEASAVTTVEVDPTAGVPPLRWLRGRLPWNTVLSLARACAETLCAVDLTLLPPGPADINPADLTAAIGAMPRLRSLSLSGTGSLPGRLRVSHPGLRRLTLETAPTDGAPFALHLACPRLEEVLLRGDGDPVVLDLEEGDDASLPWLLRAGPVEAQTADRLAVMCPGAIVERTDPMDQLDGAFW
ncbi:hypothetical protein PAPYR_7681 [Paratrimastix pyriformis]|uniref:Uncharacterized protein n=1 Tax=Paratrimastix pyriformis TaxID=342808 RepID=A0ABQ8UCF8_9EUKA|nr:hypothetical protein PAPYR_7681 [Paratrimastix pyriformis]